MATDHDLIVIGANYTSAYQNLERIARGFAENAQVVEDVRGALGHAGLAAEFKSFSDSWRIKREAMQKGFEALAKDIKTQYETWDKLDHDLGGGDSATAATTSGTGTTPTNAPTTSASSPAPGTEGGRPTTQPSAGIASSLPAATAASSGMTGGADTASSVVDASPTTGADGGGSDVGIVATPVAAALSGAGILGAIYAIWKGIQDGKNPGGGDGGGTGDALSVRDRINRELSSLKGVTEAGYDIELIADPKDPDDIMAILRGEDGDTISLTMDDADVEAEAEPGVGEGGEPVEASVAEPPTAEAEPAADEQTGLPPSSDAVDDSAPGGLPAGGVPLSEQAGAQLPAPAASAFAGSDASSPFDHGSTSGFGLETDSLQAPAGDQSKVSTGSLSSPAVDPGSAGAGVGMMGMGAMGAQQMMSSAATTPTASRPRDEKLRPAEPAPSDETQSEERK